MPDTKMQSPADADRLQAEAMQFYALAAVSFIVVAVVMLNAPSPRPGPCDGVSLAWMVKGAGVDVTGTIGQAYKCAKGYQADNPKYILGVFVSLYMSMQAFAIPGTIVLSVLAGPLFGFIGGQAAIVFSATIGSVFCFLLSQFLGKGVLHMCKLSHRLEWFRAQVHEHKDNLLLYILISRLTPVPNILINVASPLVGVPLWAFAFGTLFGLMPMNAVHVTTGRALATAAEDPSKFVQVFESNKKIGFLIFGCGSLITLFLYFRRKNGTESKAKEE